MISRGDETVMVPQGEFSLILIQQIRCIKGKLQVRDENKASEMSENNKNKNGLFNIKPYVT